MRWNSDTEAYVRRQLAADTCPLCGGRIRHRTTRVMSEGGSGRFMDWTEPVCDACGMVVEEGGCSGDW